MQHRIERFAKDETGTILVFVAMCLVLFLAMSAVTFDLGRISATQTDLQSSADHVALAAAGELDGSDGAIDRATSAAEQMIRDRQTFADGGQALGASADYDLRFLSGLPDNDLSDVSAFVVDVSKKSADRDARLVEVTATPRTVFTPFANATAALIGSPGARGTDVGAVAIAGRTGWACDIAPLMFCLPDPDFKADENIGASVRLRAGGSNASWQPGNFGFLEPEGDPDPDGPCDGLKGANLTACQIAAAGRVTQCYSTRGVDTEPGQKQGLNASIFNTRFDIFESTMNSNRKDWVFAPGPHVVKGKLDKNGKTCTSVKDPDTLDSMAFPPDSCIGGGCGRFGDGDWDIRTYLETNYGEKQHDDVNGNKKVDPGELTFTLSASPWAGMATASPPPTRYEVYTREIEVAKDAERLLPPDRQESGRPQCNTAVPPDGPYGPERRVFVAAGVDCQRNPINGSATDVPVQEFFKIFLLGPSKDTGNNPPDFNIDVEILGSAGGAGGNNSASYGLFREVVELYR